MEGGMNVHGTGSHKWTTAMLMTLEKGNDPTHGQLPGLHSEGQTSCGQPDLLAQSVRLTKHNFSSLFDGGQLGTKGGRGCRSPAGACQEFLLWEQMTQVVTNSLTSDSMEHHQNRYRKT